MSNQVAVNTTWFQFRHGHAPRGRGNWCFTTRNGDVVCFFNGPFAAARREACRVANNMGMSEVWVGE